MYPLFLDLTNRHCLVVGAGSVGLRKCRTLLAAAPASLVVIDPNPGSEARSFFTAWEQNRQNQTCVRLLQRTFLPDDITGMTLVFAATSSKQVNEAILACCNNAGVFCNSATDQKKSHFFVPATIERAHIHLALSTKGSSPALAKVIRTELEEWLDNRYDALAELLSRLRPLVLAMGLETGQNTLLFRKIVHSPLAEYLRNGERRQAEALLQHMLPETLHPSITELLHDLA